jgi:hypothetical protein
MRMIAAAGAAVRSLKRLVRQEVGVVVVSVVGSSLSQLTTYTHEMTNA